jgi:uncharacterized protein
MLLRRLLLICLLLPLLFVSPLASAQLDFPKATDWINDFANVLDVKTKKRLTEVCKELDKKTNAQIAVVTIDSIGKTPIGDYARLLFNQWGIGHKEDNRGMLVLLVIKEHMYYISVGTGFEALFPNERASKIGSGMTPYLEKSLYGVAVTHSVDEIADIIAKDRHVILTTLLTPKPEKVPVGTRPTPTKPL